MIHAQIDVELRDHERITGALLHDVPEQWRPMMRTAMLGLFTWCLLYGQAKRLEEGLIPVGTVHGALNGGQQPVARALVDAGLLDEFETHYRIRKYAEKNRTRTQIEASIAATAERQARCRVKRQSATPENAFVTRESRVAPGSGSGSGSGSDLKRPEGSESQAPPEPVTETRRASGAAGFAADAWCDGVRSVTHGRPTLAPWERAAIEDLARDRPPETNPSDWGHAEGMAFAARQRASEPRLLVTAAKYLDWVGSGRLGPHRPSTRHTVPDTPPAPYHKSFRVKRNELAPVTAEEAVALAAAALGKLGTDG